MPGLPPAPVTWAMRPETVFVTICVPDCKDVTLDITSNSIYFKGTGGADKKSYENNLDLYGEIDAEKSRKFIRDRNIEILLVRKESGPYWPHLLQSKTKQHWLKVDFSKWKDEDDDEEEEGGGDKYNDLISQMGGMGGGMGGLGGMGGMGGMGMGDAPPNLDDLGDGDETDSDDEELPDLA